MVDGDAIFILSNEFTYHSLKNVLYENVLYYNKSKLVQKELQSQCVLYVLLNSFSSRSCSLLRQTINFAYFG